MTLPTHEELSVGTTRTFVNKTDIERFDDYVNSFDDIVIPIEIKAKECNMTRVIEESHVAETTIEHLNKEIVRMIYWSKEDFKPNTERLAKKYKDVRDRYHKARDILQYGCQCTKKK
jgi:lipoate-protein ligase A